MHKIGLHSAVDIQHFGSETNATRVETITDRNETLQMHNVTTQTDHETLQMHNVMNAVRNAGLRAPGATLQAGNVAQQMHNLALQRTEPVTHGLSNGTVPPNEKRRPRLSPKPPLSSRRM